LANLNENSTVQDIEEFLLFHMDEADERKSTINPSLTKKQVWNINMSAITRGTTITRVHNIMLKNIKKEFGSYYEKEEQK
jgi:hypothetical protein